MKTLNYIVIVISFTVFILLSINNIYAKTAHSEFKNATLQECFDCHKESNVPSNHDFDFVKEHRILAEKSGGNCIECHEQSFCIDCHFGGGIDTDLKKSTSMKGNYMPKTHRSDFISLHSIKAMDNPQNCYRCHDASFCADCHTKQPQKNKMSIKSHTPAGTSQLYIWSSEHAAEARRNMQSCASCHPDGDVCVTCHKSGGVNPHPKNWKSVKNNVRDKGVPEKTCKKCHITY